MPNKFENRLRNRIQQIPIENDLKGMQEHDAELLKQQANNEVANFAQQAEFERQRKLLESFRNSTMYRFELEADTIGSISSLAEIIIPGVNIVRNEKIIPADVKQKCWVDGEWVKGDWVPGVPLSKDDEFEIHYRLPLGNIHGQLPKFKVIGSEPEQTYSDGGVSGSRDVIKLVGTQPGLVEEYMYIIMRQLDLDSVVISFSYIYPEQIHDQVKNGIWGTKNIEYLTTTGVFKTIGFRSDKPIDETSEMFKSGLIEMYDKWLVIHGKV